MAAIEVTKVWWRTYFDEIRFGLWVVAFALFFTHGLPLWNEDYSQWLSQANGDFFQLLKKIVLPLGWETQTWGYSDRPVQILIYKLLFTVFGYWGTGYFFVKSLVFGVLCAIVYHALKQLNVSKLVAGLSVSMLAVSSAAMASLVLHSDFGIYANLVLLITLLYSYHFIENGPSGLTIWRRGITSLPKPFVKFLILFFVLVYFGSKIRADLRLVPVILLLFLYFFEKSKFKTYLGPFLLTFLATLPWSKSMISKIPPFLPGATGYEGWTYVPFSLVRVFQYVFGGILSFEVSSPSVIKAYGLMLCVAAFIFGIHQVYADKIRRFRKQTLFFVIWFVVVLLAGGIIKRQPGLADARYAFPLLIPAVFLFAFVFSAISNSLNKYRWFNAVLFILFAMQAAIHLYGDVQVRKHFGRPAVAINKVHEALDTKYASMNVVYEPGFQLLGWHETKSFSLLNRKVAANDNDIHSMSVGSTYFVSWLPTLDARFSLEFMASGCGSSLFDAIFRCAPSEGVALSRYVGNAPELEQAVSLSKSGSVKGARDVLVEYLKRDPWNHGIAFSLSLYAYRLGEFNLMEQLYDQIGPYHPNVPSVKYNWGLAKQGVGKFDEAVTHLEAVYKMSPGNYGIGFNLADSYFKKGQKRRALATINELLKIYPNDRAMKAAREGWSKQ